MTTYYDLDMLQAYSEELGFSVRRSSPDALEIQLVDDVILEFRNLRDEEDTIAGFRGVPSHFHGKAVLETGNSTHVELDELDVLKGIKPGEILIAERYVDGTLRDRWIAHKHEKMDVKYIEPGEEMRIYRLP